MGHIGGYFEVRSYETGHAGIVESFWRRGIQGDSIPQVDLPPVVVPMLVLDFALQPLAS